MSEVPERIWATKSMARQLDHMHTNIMGQAATPYIREDIHEAVMATNRELVAQIAELVEARL